MQWYIAGLPLWVLARIIADRIQAEQWNLQCLAARGENMISYPAFEAFIRPQHVSTVEQKLQLLFAQHVRSPPPVETWRSRYDTCSLFHSDFRYGRSQAEATSGSIYHMIRVLLAPDKKRVFLEAHEPVSGSSYQMEWSGDFTRLRSIPKQDAPGEMVELLEDLNATRTSNAFSYAFMQPTYDHLYVTV